MARVFRILLITAFFAPAVLAQREQQIQAPEPQQYGRRFFVQLRAVFGRFRETDLQRAFEAAQPIQCSELINDKGEWRTVAFFNERRELGDWYRSNFEEVRKDLAVYVFKGVCRGERGPVQLTTKFPVTESVEAYQRGQIGLDEIEVNVNAPVSASFDSRSQAYSFELPYLFLVRSEDSGGIYSLSPPTLADRAKYATDVIDHWDCKSVTGPAVTYQFLICRTTTLPRDPVERAHSRAPAFGASAYFILSDGREASSSVKLSFNNDSVEDVSPAAGNVEPPAEQWLVPDPEERMPNVTRDEFRLIFPSQSWKESLKTAQLIAGRSMMSLTAAQASPELDYCMWLPGAGDLDRLLADNPSGLTFSATPRDFDGQSASSLTFAILNDGGSRVGTLQCVFPRTNSVSGITFGRWKAIVGDHVQLKVRF